MIGILGHTACNRSHGVHGAATEFGQCFLIDEWGEIFVVQLLNLLNFM